LLHILSRGDAGRFHRFAKIYAKKKAHLQFSLAYLVEHNMFFVTMLYNKYSYAG